MKNWHGSLTLLDLKAIEMLQLGHLQNVPVSVLLQIEK